MTNFAPGWPGIEPRWTSSAKSGIGTAHNAVSHVWFTLSHGIVNEVYYPRVDQACMRDLQLLITDRESEFWEEKRDLVSNLNPQPNGAPAFTIINSEPNGRFQIEKQILTDPLRDVLLQRIRLASNSVDNLETYLLLAPHVANRGWGNTAWVGDYKGHPMLFAERDGAALALASSIGWDARSVGFVGISDGWQDLSRHKTLTREYERAENGNVAMVGRLPLTHSTEALIAVGFGSTPHEAGQRALASLEDGFQPAWDLYCQEWNDWLKDLDSCYKFSSSSPLACRSRTVLRIHESKKFPGGVIASLSIPWGMSKSDDDLGGYHLVWPRDLVETAGAMVAIGAHDDAIRVANFLESTQEEDGHWAQNMWLDGSPYWGGVQMDETAFPILLVDLLRRQLDWTDEWKRYWPMVRKAARYLVCNGPVTQQDRWEEDAGYSPFTLAAEVAALLAAADFADLAREHDVATYLRSTADVWNEGIERWTYTTHPDLTRQYGVEGYYVRIAPPDVADCSSPSEGYVPIKNRPPGETCHRTEEIISPDALALVRFGLRNANDPRILNTVSVIDQLLKFEFQNGPAWYRYNSDGYGEHDDGRPFDGTGTGRPWPLLTGERAHYEIAAGNLSEATRLCETFASFSGVGGMLPEQVWDAPDCEEHGLEFGRPSGSAMPLVWAHAEYLKLLRSIDDGRIFDMPPQPVERYQKNPPQPTQHIWRFNHKCKRLPASKNLRIELLYPAEILWTTDGWDTVDHSPTVDTGIGIHLLDLPTDTLPHGAVLDFTIFWIEADHWEGTDFHVEIQDQCQAHHE